MFFVCSNPVRFFATDASYHSYLSRIGVMTFHALYNIEITNRPVVSKVIIMQAPCNTVMMDSFINIVVKDVIIYLSNSLPEVMNFPEVWRSVSAAAAAADDDDIYHPGQFYVVNQHQQQQQQEPNHAHAHVAAAFLPPPSPPTSPPPPYGEIILISNASGNDVVVVSDTDDADDADDEDEDE